MYRIKSETLVLISNPIIKHCDETSKFCANKHETGGIIMGALRGPHIELVSITNQLPKDISNPFSFIRQDPKHCEIAHEQWKKSDGTITFIGEWHTHPSGLAAPSIIDKKNWQKITKHSEMPMIFIIIAPNNWAIYMIYPHKYLYKQTRLAYKETGSVGVLFSTMQPIEHALR